MSPRVLMKWSLVLVIAFSIQGDNSADRFDVGSHYSLVYFSNETSARYLEGQNISVLLHWLETIPGQTAAELAEGIRRDSIEFSNTVDAETRTIISAAPTSTGVAIISNSSVIQGHYLVKPPAGNTYSAVQVDAAPLVSDKRLEHLPLSDPSVFRHLLRDAISRIAAGGQSIILVVKSHGDDSFAVKPRTFIDTNKATYAEIVDFIGSHDAGSNERSVSWLSPIGIEKHRLMSILEEEANRKKARFSLIFLESCKAGSGLLLPDQISSPYVQTWKLGPSVEYFVYSSDEQTPYANIRYQDLFRNATESGSLLEAFLSESKRAGLTIEQNRKEP